MNMPYMEIGNPNRTKAPAENQAIKCGSVPLTESSRLYQTTPAAVAATELHMRTRPKKCIKLRVDCTMLRGYLHLHLDDPLVPPLILLVLLLMLLLLLLLLLALPQKQMRLSKPREMPRFDLVMLVLSVAVEDDRGRSLDNFLDRSSQEGGANASTTVGSPPVAATSGTMRLLLGSDSHEEDSSTPPPTGMTAAGLCFMCCGDLGNAMMPSSLLPPLLLDRNGDCMTMTCTIHPSIVS
mmetsp:Transcript_21586/g.39048  ORF Transcript_21586/g.39048 Transcript_21586/m.39048 type:complete len:238 (-) Transcript_21586:246-959(-)